MNPDITSRKEVEQLVNNFYDRVNADPDLGKIFNQQAQVNWSTHLPQMYDFGKRCFLVKQPKPACPFPNTFA